MRILQIAYYSSPDINGGVKRPKAFSDGLEKFGHEVFTLTHGINGMDHETTKVRIKDVYDKTGLFWKLCVVADKITRKFKLLMKVNATYYSSWMDNCIKQSNEIIKIVRPDLIIASYPPVECLLLGMHFSNAYQVPLVADFRDPIVDESAEQFLINRHPHLERFFEDVERNILKAASAIIVIAPSMKKYYDQMLCKVPVYLIPNGYDNCKISTSKKGVSENSKFSISYTGTLSHYDKDRDLSEFFSAIKIGIEKRPELFGRLSVHLYGNISRSDLGEHKDLLDVGAVKIHGVVEMSKTSTIQEQSDALLLVTGTERRCVATGKIFEYMSSGRPVIALTKNTYAEEIVLTTGIGLCASPRSVDEIYSLLLNTLERGSVHYDPKDGELKKYNRTNQIKALDKIIRSVVNVNAE